MILYIAGFKNDNNVIFLHVFDFFMTYLLAVTSIFNDISWVYIKLNIQVIIGVKTRGKQKCFM